MKLVGELYNYRLVDSVLVFDCLYQPRPTEAGATRIVAGQCRAEVLRFIGFGGPTSHRAGQFITAGAP